MSCRGLQDPLAGVLTGLDWAATHRPDLPWIATVPTDAPFLPADLVAAMLAAVEAEQADMATVASGGRRHPVVGLWPVGLRHALRQALVEEGVRKVDVWTARYRLAVVEFPTDPVDPFFNANRPEDMEAAASRLALSRNRPVLAKAGGEPRPTASVYGRSTVSRPGTGQPTRSGPATSEAERGHSRQSFPACISGRAASFPGPIRTTTGPTRRPAAQAFWP